MSDRQSAIRPHQKRNSHPALRRIGFLRHVLKHNGIALTALVSLVIVFTTACEINKFRHGEEMYRARSFAAAIEEFDAYIKKSENGAIRTRAELLRSSSYRELTMMAMERQNWQLAIRFAKLSNSESADTLLANVYKHLADTALKENRMTEGQYFMNLILTEIPASIHVPTILNKRIDIAMNAIGDWNAAWRDYMRLFDNFAGHPYELQARPALKGFNATRIEYAGTLAETGFYREALAVLFELARYPVADQDKVNRLISEIYQTQAEIAITQQSYMEADRLFRMAADYYPAHTSSIQNRLVQIAGLFVQKGDEFLAAYDFVTAMLHYHRAFEIIPNYKAAADAIDRLNTIRVNIQRAAQLADEADRFDTQKKFADALRLYQEAAALHNKPEYRQNIAEMQNMIEAERNPAAFARRIVIDYRNGLLNTRISNVKRELLVLYKPNEIKDSGWKIMLSTGQYRYEARYDILTPRETYFYIWQINLRDRSIVPLNKISEALMQ